MPRGNFIAHWVDKISASSSSSDADNCELLGANQEQAPEGQTSTNDVGSSSVMLQR